MSLEKYLRTFEDYKSKFDKAAAGKGKFKEFAELDLRKAGALDVMLALAPLEAELTELLVESPPVIVPIVADRIDFDAILADVKRTVDVEYGRYNNPELSSDNAFMVWAYARRRGTVSDIETIDEAIEWNGFFKPLCDASFLQLFTDKPITCGCKSCGQVDAPVCYDGKAPQTVQECDDIRHILRKIKPEGKYGFSHDGGIVALNDESWVILARGALETLQAQNYQIKPGDRWMRHAWPCGVLAIDILRRQK
jgi:hypothetical protein